MHSSALAISGSLATSRPAPCSRLDTVLLVVFTPEALQPDHHVHLREPQLPASPAKSLADHQVAAPPASTQVASLTPVSLQRQVCTAMSASGWIVYREKLKTGATARSRSNSSCESTS